MKLLFATTLAFWMVSEIFAEAVVWDDDSPRFIHNWAIDKRATLNTPPLPNPLCDSQVLKVADISSAVQRTAYL